MSPPDVAGRAGPSAKVAPGTATRKANAARRRVSEIAAKRNKAGARQGWARFSYQQQPDRQDRQQKSVDKWVIGAIDPRKSLAEGRAELKVHSGLVTGTIRSRS